MTRSKQESTATISLVNLMTKRESVFMAFCSRLGISITPFWQQNAVFAYTFWLRLRRVRWLWWRLRVRITGLRLFKYGRIQLLADLGCEQLRRLGSGFVRDHLALQQLHESVLRDGGRELAGSDQRGV